MPPARPPAGRHASALPRTILRTAPRVPLEYRAADPFHHGHLDLAASGEDRLELPAVSLAGGQLACVDPASGGEFAQGRLERGGGQLGAGVGPPDGRDPLLAGGRVLAGEQPMHRLLAGHTFRPARSARLPSHQPGDSPLPA